MGKIAKYLLFFFLLNTSLFAEVVSIKCEKGTEVKALEEGVVKDKGYSSPLGVYVSILSENRIITYCHLSMSNVQNEQNICKNEVIGMSGSSGYVLESDLELIIFYPYQNDIVGEIVDSKDKKVFSGSNGIILDCGFSEKLGNYVVIYTLNEIITYYKLETILVHKDEEVMEDSLIGNASFNESLSAFQFAVYNETKKKTMLD